MPGKSFLRKKRKFNKKGNNGPPNGPPAKKPTPSPAGATKTPTRSATENDRLKKEKDGLKGENEALKLELLELKKTKKEKAEQVKLLSASVKDDKVFTLLRKGLLEDVYNSFKFVNCTDDEYDLMHSCLQHTTDWDKIKALDGPDLDAVVKSFVEYMVQNSAPR